MTGSLLHGPCATCCYLPSEEPETLGTTRPLNRFVAQWPIYLAIDDYGRFFGPWSFRASVLQ